MEIEFQKLQGAGNDFVLIDLIAHPYQIEDEPELARRLCDRHAGVGADGLIFAKRGDHAPFRMVMLNPDGTNGGMCGNGVRCSARLLVESGHQRLAPFRLEVEDRIVEVDPVRPDWIRVNMAKAFLKRGEIGMLGQPDSTFIESELPLGREFLERMPGDLGGIGYIRRRTDESDLFLHATAVSMGNPHLIVFCEDVDVIDLNSIGPILEHHPLFPFRTNVHFAQVLSGSHIKQRTWERGAGVTLACGSGACSVCVAGFLTHRTGREATVSLPGGDLLISYMEDGQVLMEGPAVRSFEGVWIAEDFDARPRQRQILA